MTTYQYRADQLERAFEQMGLVVHRDSSRVSRSEYVEVESQEYTESEGERGETLKFRVSDHELPRGYAQPDYDVIADSKEHGGVAWNKSGTWVEAVEWVAGMWNLPEPAVLRQTKARAATQAQKELVRVKQAAIRFAQERLNEFDTAVAAGKVTGKKSNSGIWSLSGVPYVNLGAFPGEAFNLDKAISRAREKIVAEVETRRMDAEGAPTSTVDPDSAGSRSLGASRNEMQERLAVRADESGSPEESAQSGCEAGSDMKNTTQKDAYPDYRISDRFSFDQGDKVIANGYPGVVTSIYAKNADGTSSMVVVRLPGGSACVSASYPDCFPAISNGCEVVLEGRHSGRIEHVGESLVIQNTGRGRTVAHLCHRMVEIPTIGLSVTINYDERDPLTHSLKGTVKAHKNMGKELSR